MLRRAAALLILLTPAAPLAADGPGDNIPEKVRRIPPPGIAIPDADRRELQAGVETLGKEIADLRPALAGKPDLLDLLPDVQIFHNAVRYALAHNEFYDLKEVTFARNQLRLGAERAKELREGKPSWTTKTGLVVRGYKSIIDDSVQPYGLVVPASYKPGSGKKHRLDFWCHGRGEKLTELSFIQGRLMSPGEFTPPDAFVLHLYGRYCNANKFAGETDLIEAFGHVSTQYHYQIDHDRRVMRGFSMGGAAAWHFAVHRPSFFCAAAPGAGFSETPEFLRVFQNEPVQPTWYEKKLWNMYDCPGYAVNLFNLPTVAYSGEIDRQKQAADVMERAMAKEGLKLTHLIGPKTGHSYHKDTKVELNRLIDEIAAKGRDPRPKHIKFATYTLRYYHSFWLALQRLEEHWTQARAEAEIVDINQVKITTKNVAALSLMFSRDPEPEPLTGPDAKVVIDGQTVPIGVRGKAGIVYLLKNNRTWSAVASLDDGKLHKQPGLMGPIDDAFLTRFIMVKPTGTPLHEKTGKWAAGEMAHAIEHWRRQFRGEAIVKADTDITDADIASSNLVLWGDPQSNKVLARIIDKLPNILGQHDAARFVPVLIYPNPLNPKRYVVLNSGFTFREYDYLNNARQVPKLPDWALIDTSVPPDARRPGGIADAGFFDEEWKLKSQK